MSKYTSLHPYRGGKSSRLKRIYPFYGTKWMSDMFWNDQELDHVFFIFNPHYMCLDAPRDGETSCDKSGRNTGTS